MNIVNERIMLELQAALELRPAELIRTREIALERLSQGQRVAISDIWAAVARDAGLEPNLHLELDVFRAMRNDKVSIDPDTPALRTQRLRRTHIEVLADLHADGLVVPMAAMEGGVTEVQLTVSDMPPGGGGSRGGVTLPMPAPAIAGAYRLSRRLLDDPQWRLSHESRVSRAVLLDRGELLHGCERAWWRPRSAAFDAAVGVGLAA